MSLTDAARDAIAQLEALARDLAERGFETSLAQGETLQLNVVNSVVTSLHETVSVAPADDGAWSFWWSWGDRITGIADVETAAFKIAYVLIPQADHQTG